MFRSFNCNILFAGRWVFRPPLLSTCRPNTSPPSGCQSYHVSLNNHKYHHYHYQGPIISCELKQDNQRWRYQRRLLIIKVHAWWLDSIKVATTINKDYVSNQFSAIRNNDGFLEFSTTLAQKFGLPT